MVLCVFKGERKTELKACLFSFRDNHKQNHPGFPTSGRFFFSYQDLEHREEGGSCLMGSEQLHLINRAS